MKIGQENLYVDIRTFSKMELVVYYQCMLRSDWLSYY